MRSQNGANALAEFRTECGGLARNVDQDHAGFIVTAGDGQEQFHVIRAPVGDNGRHLQRTAQLIRNFASGRRYLFD